MISLGLDSGEFKSGLSNAERDLKKTTKSFEKIGKSMQSLGTKLSIGLTAPLAAFGVASVKAASESRDAMGQVEAALKSMGSAAGRTKDQLADLATKGMRSSLYDDDEILRKVTANLLTFGKISGKAFDQAQQAAIDLSARLGTDLQGSAVMLGKALNDPVKGITALTRVGVSFTEAQKKQIKAMAETGNVAGAQSLILAELNRQYGGSAQAALDAAGPLAKIKKSFDEISETVGAAILPALERLTPYIQRAADAFMNLSPGMQTAIVAGAALAAALGPVLIGLGALVGFAAPVLGFVKTLVAAQGAGMAAAGGLGSIAAVLIRLSPLVLAGYVAWKNWDTIAPALESIGRGLGVLEGKVSSAAGSMSSTLEQFAANAVSSGAATQAQFDQISAGLAQIRNTGKVDPATAQSITDLIAKMQEAGTVTPQEAEKVRKALRDMWTAQDAAEKKDQFEQLASDIRGAFDWILKAQRDVDQASKVFWGNFWKGFSDFTQGLNRWGAEVGAKMLQIGRDMISGLIRGIMTGGPSLGAALTGLMNTGVAAAKKAIDSNSPSRVFMEIGTYIGDGLAIGIEGGKGKVAAATRKLTESARKAAEEVKSLLAELFPESVARNAFQRGSAILDGAKSKLGAEAYEEARYRLNQRYSGALGHSKGEIPISVMNDNTALDVTKGMEDVLDKLDTFGKKAGSVTVNVAKSFKDMADATIQSLQNLAGSIKGGGFLDILSAVVGLGMQLGSIGAFGKTIAGRINKVPGYANGTNFHPGGLAVVGERGPELVSMPRGSRVTPNGEWGAQKLQVEVVANNNGFGAIVRNHAGQVVAEAAHALIDGGAQAGVARMGYSQRRRVA